MAGSEEVNSKGWTFSEEFDDACDDSQEGLGSHDGQNHYSDDEMPLFEIVVLDLRDSVEGEDGKGEEECEEDSAKSQEDMDEHPEGPVFVEGEDDSEVDDEGPDVEHGVVVGEGAPGVFNLQHSSFEVFHGCLNLILYDGINLKFHIKCKKVIVS